ncbi:MAG: S-adenosyl-methyltransferase MraW [Candidatus Kaiserbacteria bacterium]|nr:S-adenosyl-methyltransferase MraW [Candidatus Kaiserbacteria bacterium]
MRTRLLPSSNDSVSSEKPEMVKTGHRTVLLQEAIEILEIKVTDVALDATLGGIGHSRLMADRLGKKGMLIGFDLDSEAIARAKDILHGSASEMLFINKNFRYIERELQAREIPHIDKALFDLGWSGFQLTAGRGFSFLRDEPLLMTYGDGLTGLTAREIVNEWDEESIADIIYGWGEEHYSRGIARSIVTERSIKPIETSMQLAEIVRSSVPAAYRKGRLHPATKTFQALRIAVNDEMGALRDGLNGAWNMLRPGGRIAVITFHSIEDRFVKQYFLKLETDGLGERVTRKVIAPSREEVRENPRARSAKLRVVTKI